jgi:hypothetical protein
MPRLDSGSTKKSAELTLIDKLSRLSYRQTLKLLGSASAKLLRAGDKWDFRIEEDVYLSPDMFRLKFPLSGGEDESTRPIVPISLTDPAYRRLQWICTACESLCEHVGTAFAFILDEKMTLGLAAPPPERVLVESLSEKELICSDRYKVWNGRDAASTSTRTPKNSSAAGFCSSGSRGAWPR